MYGLKPAPFKTGPLLLNDERPGVEAGSFLIQFHYVNCSKWSVTHLPCWRLFDLVWMVRHGRLLHRMRGWRAFYRLCVRSWREGPRAGLFSFDPWRQQVGRSFHWCFVEEPV